MKKLLTIILALALILPTVVLADLPDLSGMSFFELKMLKLAVNAAMWESSEWKQVTVPEGIYQVGKEIPAGEWEITAIKGNSGAVAYFEKMNEYGTEPDKKNGYYWFDYTFNDGINPNSSLHLTLVDGMYIKVMMCPMVFAPYTGPDFTFE